METICGNEQDENISIYDMEDGDMGIIVKWPFQTYIGWLVQKTE